VAHASSSPFAVAPSWKRHVALLTVFLMEFGDYPMMRKLLLGAKRRLRGSCPCGRIPARSLVAVEPPVSSLTHLPKTHIACYPRRMLTATAITAG